MTTVFRYAVNVLQHVLVIYINAKNIELAIELMRSAKEMMR